MWKEALANVKIDDFTFFDPKNRETPVEYNSLFDPHLQQFFSRRNVRNVSF